MPRIIKTISHDISRSFVISFMALLIVIPSVILFVVLLYENNHNDLSDSFLIIVSVVWMSVFIGGMLFFIFNTSHCRKKWLDSVFTPLGLTGHRYLINWWEYTGQLAGRELTVRFYKGPTLDIILSTPLGTRFGVSTPNELGTSLATMLNKSPLNLNVPELREMTAYALDEDWFTHRLASPEFVNSLVRLLKAGESWALLRQVLLAPGQLRLTLYRNKNLFNYELSVDAVKQWVDDLLILIRIVEESPAPLITAEETTLEKTARSGNLTRRAIFILVGFFLLIGACFGLTLWLLVNFAG